MVRIAKTAILVLISLLMTAPAASAGSLDLDQRTLLKMINTKRSETGVNMIKWLPKAAQAGERLSTGRPLDRRLKGNGIRGWKMAGQNIAKAATEGGAYDKWLSAAGTRNKMLDAAYTHVGIGVTKTPDGNVYNLVLIKSPRVKKTVPAAGREILSLVNAERAKVGAAPLKWGYKLQNVARLHSADMISKNYFSHVSQDGRSLVDRLREGGVTGWNRAGENIAGTSSAVRAFELWMGSPAHHENMLDPKYTSVGIGIATDGSFNMYTMNLAAYPSR